MDYVEAKKHLRDGNDVKVKISSDNEFNGKTVKVNVISTIMSNGYIAVITTDGESIEGINPHLSKFRKA